MNKAELENELQEFEKVCYSEGYIYDALSFDEAYLGVVPTSFIVNVVAKKSWTYANFSKALDKLIEILWKTTEAKTRENIFTLSLYTIDEMVNSEKKRDWEQIATNPDLTPEQIKKLFNTEDKNVIALFIKRYSEDSDFEKLILADSELKRQILKYAI